MRLTGQWGITFAGLALLAVAGEAQVAPSRTTPDASVEKLIDQLVDFGASLASGDPAAWRSQFLAIDDGPSLEEGHNPVDPVMRNLIRLGVRAVPALVRHLSDRRETKFIENHSDGGVAMWFTDEYDPRFGDPQRQPKNVNTPIEVLSRSSLVPNMTYTFKVGDLCYLAIGQIVNRELVVTDYEPTAQEYINSPIHSPTLAQAVAKDWGDLTPEAHRRQLEQDANRNWPAAGADAVKRLLYYYPKDGERVALKLLNRRADAFFDEQVLVDSLQSFPNKRIDAAVQGLFKWSIRQTSSDDFRRTYLDNLVEACASRMKGKGFDRAYLAYFQRRVGEVESTPPSPPERSGLNVLKAWVRRFGGDE